MRIKKGDMVKVIAGKDRGKTGKVLRVLHKDNRVVVEGVNLAKKRQRPRNEGSKGQIVTLPLPLHASNVMIVTPKSHLPTRVGVLIKKDGKKVRITKKENVELS